MRKKQLYKPPSFDTIQAAVHEDSEKIEEILKHYERYMLSLSLRPCRNNDGEIHMTVDPDVLCRVKSKLIAKILKFKIY